MIYCAGAHTNDNELAIFLLVLIELDPTLNEINFKVYKMLVE